MKVTLLEGAERTPVDGCINPERVDGAYVHSYPEDGGLSGTLLAIGPEEVLIQEPFPLVREQLEEAWDARRRNEVLDEVLVAVRPFAAVLPLLVPSLVDKAMKRAKGGAVDDETRPEGEASTPPPGPLDAVPPTELVWCSNCGKHAARAALCAHCGAALEVKA